MSYSVAFWLPIVTRLVAAEYPRIDVNFAMKWLEVESGGNPCAIGAPGQVGPDGNPREIGLGQGYNGWGPMPGDNDFRAFGVTPEKFRAYCVPSTQVASRTLTNEEQDDQVRYTLLAKIEQGMQHADELVTKYGLQWGTCDYYKLVKAPHALPGILGQGLPAVVSKLGRAPKDWAEFRSVLGMEHFEMWRRALDACETCGNAAQAAA